LKGRATESDVTAQMLTRGTIKHTRQQIKDEFDRLKAQVGISGGATGASATVQTIRENLKPVLELLAEVLKEPAFPQNEFEELRQSALASMEYQKSDPQAIAMNAVQRYLSPYPKGDVRYVSTLDEEVEEMKALDLEKVKAFYKDFYGASDSLIAFVGDFDGNETVKQISALFESWKSPKKYVRVNNKYQKIAPKTEVFQTPDKANAMWIAAAQFQMTDADPDYAAMTLAGYIFGSSPMNSRLFARIRNKEGLSYGVGSQFSIPTEDDNSVMFNYAICAPENMPKVEKIFKEELNLMIEKGFTSEEVAAAKKSWQQLQQVGRAQDSSLVSLLNTRRSWNRTMTFDSELEKKIAALTPEQLQAAVRKHIDPSQLSFFRAGDFKKVNVAW
jgi:zinc protease